LKSYDKSGTSVIDKIFKEQVVGEAIRSSRHEIYFEGKDEPETKDLWEKITEAAKKAGIKTNSEYIRKACLNAVNGTKILASKSNKALIVDFKKEVERKHLKSLDNISVKKFGNGNCNIDISNIADGEKVKTRVSFYSRKGGSKVQKVTKNITLLRKGNTIKVEK